MKVLCDQTQLIANLCCEVSEEMWGEFSGDSHLPGVEQIVEMADHEVDLIRGLGRFRVPDHGAFRRFHRLNEGRHVLPRSS